MTWQNLADDLADEFGAYEPPPVHEQLAGYVAERMARRNERLRKLREPKPAATARPVRATATPEQKRERKTQWQRDARTVQRMANPPRKPGRPRKSDEHKHEVERTYMAARRGELKHARMLAGELVSMTPLEARERTRRLLGG